MFAKSGLRSTLKAFNQIPHFESTVLYYQLFVENTYN